MQDEDQYVEVFRVGKPNEPKRMVTREAAGFMYPKWQRTDSVQASEDSKKNAAPAVDNNAATLALEKLREAYKNISGKDADPSWTHARVHIEIRKAENATINEVPAPTEQEIKEAGVTEAPVYEAPEYAQSEPEKEVAEEAAPKKRGRKAKTEGTPA